MNAEPLSQIQPLFDQLSREEKIRLVDQLTKQLQPESTGQREEIKGLWEGAAPEDFEIDEALKEIRQGWWRRVEDLINEPPTEE